MIDRVRPAPPATERTHIPNQKRREQPEPLAAIPHIMDRMVWDNRALRHLPVDPDTRNVARQVSRSVLALVLTTRGRLMGVGSTSGAKTTRFSTAFA